MYRRTIFHFLVAALLAVRSYCAACTVNASSTGTCALKANAIFDPYNVSTNDIAALMTVSSLTECANQCARRRVDDSIGQNGQDVCFSGGCFWCQSIAFNAKTGLCRLLGAPIGSKIVTVDPTSDFTFYDLDCFDCGATCDQPFGENLLDNGDFEQMLLGPWANTNEQGFGYAPKRFMQQVASVEGSRVDQCYAIHEDPDEFLPCAGQALNICPGSLYTIAFDYSVPAKRGKKVQAGLFNSWTHDITIEPSDTDTSWKTVRSFTRGRLGAGDLLFVFDQFDRGDKNPILSIDNVAIKRIRDHPALLPGAKSVFRNGGFESGSLGPWKNDPRKNYRVVFPGLRGSKHAIKTRKNPHRIGFIKQELSTKPATSYLLSFDYAPAPKGILSFDYAPATKGKFGLQFLFGRRGNSTDISFGNVPIEKGTQRITIPFYSDNSTTVFFIRPIFVNDFPSILLDNFSLIELAETQF